MTKPSKKQLAPAAAIFNSDGSPDFAEMGAQSLALHEQHSAGHFTLRNGKATQTSIPGGQHVVIEYDVMEN